jgi:hypothetical protein
VAEKLVTMISLVVALVAVATTGWVASASAKADAIVCAGKLRLAVGAPRTRRPVAMVPGLRYDPRTMIPRGITPARATPDPTRCSGEARAAVGAPSTKHRVAVVPGLKFDPRTMIPRGI